jgi:hypothetical protein
VAGFGGQSELDIEHPAVSEDHDKEAQPATGGTHTQLRFPLPVGLVYAEPEGIVLDPDQEVQGAVRLVFATFAQAASAYGVVSTLYSTSVAFS